MMLWTPLYRRIIITFALVVISGDVLRFILPLIAYDLRGEVFDIAILRSVTFLPNIFLGMLVGIFNDRADLNRAYRLYVTGMAAVLGVSSIVVATNNFGLPLLMTSLIGFQIGFIAFGNAQMSVLKLALPKEMLIRSNSVTSGISDVSSVVGPALGGLLIVTFGSTMVLMLCFFTLLIVRLQLFKVEITSPVRKRKSFLFALLEGLRATTANRTLLVMALVVMMVNAAEGVYGAALITMMKDSMNLNDATIGLVLSAAGGGAILGAFIAPTARKYLSVWGVFSIPIPIIAMIYFAISRQPETPFLSVLAFLEGALSSLFVVGILTFRQEVVDAEVMGRVAGITGAIFKIGMPPFILLGGWLQSTVSIAAPFVLAAVSNLMVFAILFFADPGNIRRAGRGETSSRT
jgi:MFS transporter, DHA3 family, macrolide efflux protein